MWSPPAPSSPHVLLIRRGNCPYQGHWALPGGFVDEMEPLRKAAERELHEETSLGVSEASDFFQVGAFADPGRDPRGWTASVAFAALLERGEAPPVRGGDDAAEARWFAIPQGLPATSELAFDHPKILAVAFRALAARSAQSEERSALKEALEGAAKDLEGDAGTDTTMPFAKV